MQSELRNELKIMTWNIKGGASLGWENSQQKIKSLEGIVKKIFSLKAEADIIVLTEFIITKGVEYLFEKFQIKGYIWFQTTRTGKNGVLIAIKKKLVNYNELKEQVWYDDIVSSQFEGCNILKVTLPLTKCGKELSIIGCRMESGVKKEKEPMSDSEKELLLRMQYDSERNNFDNILIPMIRPLKKGQLYIVCSDFNNARCLGKLNEKFNSQNYNGKSQCNYNLNIIKDTFDSIGFTMVDVDENGNAIPTHKGYYPDDHIFVYGFQPMSFGVVPSAELSDHDILWSKVKVY